MPITVDPELATVVDTVVIGGVCSKREAICDAPSSMTRASSRGETQACHGSHDFDSDQRRLLT